MPYELFVPVKWGRDRNMPRGMAFYQGRKTTVMGRATVSIWRFGPTKAWKVVGFLERPDVPRRYNEPGEELGGLRTLKDAKICGADWINGKVCRRAWSRDGHIEIDDGLH